MNTVHHPGRYLARILQIKGWNQRTLVALTGYDKAHISRIIAGKVTIKRKLADRLAAATTVKAEQWLEYQKRYTDFKRMKNHEQTGSQ